MKMTKEKWLEENGFSPFEEAYLVTGNSFAIKDKLKEAGFKYSPLLRWHGPETSVDLPEDCSYIKINYTDYFFWDEREGVSFLKEKARDNLDLLFYPPRESKSQYYGAVGDLIVLTAATVKTVSGYDTAYGYRWVYVFLSCNDEFCWHSTVNKSLSPDMRVNVAGRVKDHKEYKGIKTTILTRCKIRPIEE